MVKSEIRLKYSGLIVFTSRLLSVVTGIAFVARAYVLPFCKHAEHESAVLTVEVTNTKDASIF